MHVYSNNSLSPGMPLGEKWLRSEEDMTAWLTSESVNDVVTVYGLSCFEKSENIIIPDSPGKIYFISGPGAAQTASDVATVE